MAPARCAATIAATVSVTRGSDPERMPGVAGSALRMRNGKGELRSPWLAALRLKFYTDRSKRCAIVYIRMAGLVYEDRSIFSSAWMNLTAAIAVPLGSPANSGCSFYEQNYPGHGVSSFARHRQAMTHCRDARFSRRTNLSPKIQEGARGDT